MKTWHFILTILITAIISGSGVYYWQNLPLSNENELEEVVETKPDEDVEDSDVDGESEDNSEKVSNETEEEVTSPRFDSIDKYVELVLSSDTYKVNEPSGYKRVNFGGVDLDVGPDGVSNDVYVLEPPERSGSLDTIETFYLEVVGPSPCWNEADCDEPNSVNFYGPFEGFLYRLVQ